MLLPNLQVVRIAPPRTRNGALEPEDVNASDHSSCIYLLSGLNPRKLVLRNVDLASSPVAPPCWHPTALEEVVIMLPTNASTWLDSNLEPRWFDLQEQYGLPKPHIKAVFYDTWEDTSPEQDKGGDADTPETSATARRKRDNVPIDSVARSIFSMLDAVCYDKESECPHDCPGVNFWDIPPGEYNPRKVDVYGLGRMRFKRSGLLWEGIRAANGDAMTEKTLHTSIKEQIVTGKYTSSAYYDEAPEIITGVFEPLIKSLNFHPLSAYLDDVDARRHEITAE